MKRQDNFIDGEIYGRLLWSSKSRVTLHCYPGDRSARVYTPPYNSDIRILAVSSKCETRWEDGYFDWTREWCCPALASDPKWRQLGWVMADGSLPLGELQKVDPAMAQFSRLPRTDSTRTSEDRMVPRL